MDMNDFLKSIIILFIIIIFFIFFKKSSLTQKVTILKKEEHFIPSMNGGLTHSKKIRVITDTNEIMELNILTKKNFNSINVGNQYEIERVGTICLKLKLIT